MGSQEKTGEYEERSQSRLVLGRDGELRWSGNRTKEGRLFLPPAPTRKGLSVVEP